MQDEVPKSVLKIRFQFIDSMLFGQVRWALFFSDAVEIFFGQSP